MKTLVGWSVEMQFDDRGLQVWKTVNMCDSMSDARRIERTVSSLPDALDTRVMAYYRVDPRCVLDELDATVSLPPHINHSAESETLAIKA